MSSAQETTHGQRQDRDGGSAVEEQPGAPTEASQAVAATPEGPPAATADGPGPTGAGPTVAELEDRWRRAVAELDNVRKRFERQVTDSVRAERARTVAAFLPVLDNLDLALQHAAADPATIVAGIQAVHAQAGDVLAGLGYQRIDPVGQRFDPTRHEAARVVPAGDDSAAGTVVQVHRAGFVDGAGTLVRPAVVTVAQAPQREPAERGATEWATEPEPQNR